MEKREFFARRFFLVAGAFLVISGVLMVLGFCCAVAFAQEQNTPEKPKEIDVMFKDGGWLFETGNVKITFTKPDNFSAVNAQAQDAHAKIWRQNDDKTWRLLTKFHLSAAGSQAEFGNVLSPKQEGRLNAELLKNGTFQKGDIFWVQVESTPEKIKEMGQAWREGLAEAVSGKKTEEKDKKKPQLLGNTIINLKE